MSFKTRKTKSGVSDSLDKILRNFNEDAFEIISSGITETVLDAKAIHRFKSRSGNLERSIVSEMKRSGKNIQGTILLKDAIALYGKYIHNGFRSWSADPFLRNSSEKLFPKIKNKIKSNLRQLMR